MVNKDLCKTPLMELYARSILLRARTHARTHARSILLRARARVCVRARARSIYFME